MPSFLFIFVLRENSGSVGQSVESQNLPSRLVSGLSAESLESVG